MTEGGEARLPIIPDKKTGDPLWSDLRDLTIKYTIPVKSVKPFFEALERGKLLATKCKRCGEKYFPPQGNCSRCGSDEMEWIEVGRYGKLLTYTVVKVKPESYQKYPDYVLGVARLDDGINVLAWIFCEDLNRLRRGVRIRLDFKRRMEDGYMTYYIVPEE